MKLEAVAAPPVGRHRRFANGSSSVGIAPVTLIATHTKQRGGLFTLFEKSALRRNLQSAQLAGS